MRIKDKIRVDRNALVLLMSRIRLCIETICKDKHIPRGAGKTFDIEKYMSKYESEVIEKLFNLINNAVIVTIDRTAKVMIYGKLYTKKEYKNMIRAAYR